MKSARVKFEGQFASKTRVSFTAKISPLHAASIAAPMIRSFDKVMAEEYAEKSVRPRLKKLTITILFP
ncbi:MAG: hypothetical protein WCO57_07810 [Verrucomicrobiota bacterium]